jgi:hypothetical protein
LELAMAMMRALAMWEVQRSVPCSEESALVTTTTRWFRSVIEEVIA